MEGLVYFLIFCWVATIIFTIVLAIKKGYSGFLAFLLGLFIPLLGSLIIIALLPDNKIRHSYSSNKTSYDSIYAPMSYDSTPIKVSTSVEQKICKKCGEKVNEDIFVCPKCGSESFK